MDIGNLLLNYDFSFNVPLRVVWNNNGNRIIMFDSTESGDISFDLMSHRITAINMASDGIVDIEFTD